MMELVYITLGLVLVIAILMFFIRPSTDDWGKD